MLLFLLLNSWAHSEMGKGIPTSTFQNTCHCPVQKTNPMYSSSNGGQCCMNMELSGTSNIVSDLAVHWAQIKLLLKAIYSSLPHMCLRSLLFGTCAPSRCYKIIPRSIANSVFPSLHSM